MAKLTPGFEYGQLPPGQGKTESTWWAVAVVAAFVPVAGLLLAAANGIADSGDGGAPIGTLTVWFSAAIALIAVLQVFSALRASRTVAGDTYHLPGLSRAKRLVAPVGVPVLFSVVVFEIFVIASYDFLQVLGFVLQTFAIGLASGVFGTVFWHRMRRFGRTLPHVDRYGWGPQGPGPSYGQGPPGSNSPPPGQRGG